MQQDAADDISLKFSNSSAGASAGRPGTTSRTSRAGSSSISSRSGGRSMTPPDTARRQSTKTLPAWWGRPHRPCACSPRALIRLLSSGFAQRGEADAAAAPPWQDGHRPLCTVRERTWQPDRAPNHPKEAAPNKAGQIAAVVYHQDHTRYFSSQGRRTWHGATAFVPLSLILLLCVLAACPMPVRSPCSPCSFFLPHSPASNPQSSPIADQRF